MVGFLGCSAPVDAPAPSGDDAAAAVILPAPPESQEAQAARNSSGRVAAEHTEVVQPGPAPAVGPTVLLSSSWTNDAEPKDAATTFSVNNIDNIVAYLYLPLDPGVHTAWFELLGPGGSVYEKDALAFAVGPTDQKFVKMGGLVTPVQIQPATKTDLGWRVTEIVPVSGTDIQNFDMVGGWRLEIRDATTGGQLAAASFTLTE